MNQKLMYVVIAFLFFPFLSDAQDKEARLLRFPAIYENQIVFSYAGDLYSVDADGGTARRLTSHKGYEMFPRFSPDGSRIAFTGQYDGNTEVFVMPAEGGSPERLTYTATLGRDDVADRMGPNNITMTWTPDGESIIYRSRKKSFNSFKGALFKVPADGGISEQLPFPEGGFCSYSADGKKLAYNKVFREFRTWKHYEGGMADDIWIHDFETHETKAITDNKAQDIIPMWKGNKIYFVSDRNWRMNLFSYDLETEEVKQLTDFEEFDVKFPSIGKDYIVFENGGSIYKLNLDTEEVDKVPVKIKNDLLASRNEMVDVSEDIQHSGLSPDGERAVFSSRGDVFSVPAKNGITYNLTRSQNVHDRNAEWSPDGKHIAYISDQTGEYEIFMVDKDRNNEPVQLTDGSQTYKYNIDWAPDSKKILWSNSEFELKYMDVQDKQVTLVDTSKYGQIRNYAWSPDSRWITYTKEGDNEIPDIWVYNTETRDKFKVTEGWYSSSGASFSSNGKYLLFSSSRTFDPIYSRVEWNYAYTDMEKIYLIPLQKSTPSPFEPENDEVKIDNENDDENNDGNEEVVVKIDKDGIQNRIVEIPVDASNYGNIHAINEKIYYNEYNSQTRSSKIKVFDLKEKKESTLGEKMQFSISPNNNKMLVKKKNDWTIIPLPDKEIKMEDKLDLSDMKMNVDYREQWEQIFDESWRQYRDFFYVENMHGVDWEKMKERYEELIPYVNHRNDLTYLIGLMISEMNVGHAYVQSGDRPEPERIKTGLLGADISKHESGYFRIDNILDGANWSDELRSPLNAVGVNVEKGEYILAVDGQSVRDAKSLNEMLVGKADKEVELTVNNNPRKEGSRKIIIKPRADVSDLYYYNWVQDNIKTVSEKTDGQVGYLHIPDMVANGLNEFVEHFYPQLNKKALIIDVRGNGGGNVSPMIIERLRREITRANMRRNATEPSQTPGRMMRGPMVCLIDKYSASDGDLFPYSFRKHDLGPLIGTTSWGGVVGITGSLPFIDGAELQIPQFASYSAEESEWIIEGKGVEPDIYVENDPWKEFNGIDEQLNKAIEVILEKIEKEYVPLPDIPGGPDKSEDGFKKKKE